MQPDAHGSPEAAVPSSVHNANVANNPQGEYIDEKEIAAFDHLREETYDQMWQDIIHRLETNPTPSDEERSMGTYIEAVEPQVRSAVMTIRNKGYNTLSSGFYSSDHDWRMVGYNSPYQTRSPLNRRVQHMDLEPFAISEETRQRLQALGVEAPEYPGFEGHALRIGFTPETPDLDAIATRWQAIVDVLPDTGTPAEPKWGTMEQTESRFCIYCPPDIHWPGYDADPAVQSYLEQYLRW
jgi:hypothetical protein